MLVLFGLLASAVSYPGFSFEPSIAVAIWIFGMGMAISGIFLSRSQKRRLEDVELLGNLYQTRVEAINAEQIRRRAAPRQPVRRR